MATPSQVSDTLATSTTSYRPATTPDSSASKADKVKIVDAVVNKAHLASDLSMLYNGSFSDFTVICGKQEWKVHRVILSRCSYFRPIVSERSAFKESLESEITIHGFEPLEIDWLLRYIYSLQLNVVEIQESSPHNSYLETCVLLWSIGDFFCLPDVCQRVLPLLATRCKKLFVESRSIDATINEISFLPDLEAGIRAAWRADRAAGPPRKQLMTVCNGLHPVLRDQKTFIHLLEETPEFATDFLKTLLGCAGMQMIIDREPRPVCARCKSAVLATKQGESTRFLKGAFILPSVSLSIYSGYRNFYCSRACYNKNQVSDFEYPEKLE